ncbi:hypothetical protein A2U01_0048674, partial [Trifolium medium]|nr:hypothetical protein [Trifolium medium]
RCAICPAQRAGNCYARSDLNFPLRATPYQPTRRAPSRKDSCCLRTERRNAPDTPARHAGSRTPS